MSEIQERKVGAKVSETPQVSVVVPAYNAVEFVGETLDSVLAQTFRNYEIILVNDGSPDTEKLEAVLENYYENIIYIRQKNGGTASARNTAVKAARGSLLAFLDADDIWFPEYLEAQTKILRAKNLDFIYADARLFGAVKSERETFMKKSPSRGAVETEKLIRGTCSVITSGTVARRDKVVACGMFDEELPRIGMEDFDLWFRLLKSGARAGFQRRVLLKYRVSPNSLSGSNVARARRAVVALDTLERKHELDAHEKRAMAARRKSAAAELELETGKFNLTEENYDEARANFRGANRYYRSLKILIVLLILRVKPQLVLDLFRKMRPVDFSFINPQSSSGEADAASTGNGEQNKLSLSNQSVWLLFGKVVGFALSILLPLLTVRYLAQDKVGVYRQTFLVITNAVSILPLGFSMSAFYFLSRERERRASAILNILIFNFVMGGAACLFLFLYPQFLGNLFLSDEMTRLAPRVGVVIWLWVFSTFLEIVALANQEARLAAAFIILAQFTKTVLMTSAVVFFTTVEAFIDAAIVQSIVQTAVLIIYLNRRFPRFWTKFNFAFFREQLIYALPFGLAGLLYTMQTDVHNYFVGHRFTESEFAIYTSGCFELPLIGMLYESISGVMIPRMSELESQGKRREMFLTIVGATKKLAFAYFPLFVFMMIVAEEFITTLFTKDYAASVPIFRINLLLLPFYCLILDPVARAFPSVGKFLLKTRIALFFALLAALWFGIQHFDLRGMIAVVVVVFLIEKIISFFKIAKILEVKRQDVRLLKSVGRTALAALAAGAVLFLFYWATRDFLPEVCLNLARRILAVLKFEKLAQLLGGSLYLAACAAVYFGVYLFAAYRLGALESSFKESVGGRLSVVANFFKRKDDAQKDAAGEQSAAEHRPLTADN